MNRRYSLNNISFELEWLEGLNSDSRFYSRAYRVTFCFYFEGSSLNLRHWSWTFYQFQIVWIICCLKRSHKAILPRRIMQLELWFWHRKSWFRQLRTSRVNSLLLKGRRSLCQINTRMSVSSGNLIRKYELGRREGEKDWATKMCFNIRANEFKQLVCLYWCHST